MGKNDTDFLTSRLGEPFNSSFPQNISLDWGIKSKRGVGSIGAQCAAYKARIKKMHPDKLCIPILRVQILAFSLGNAKMEELKKIFIARHPSLGPSSQTSDLGESKTRG